MHNVRVLAILITIFVGSVLTCLSAKADSYEGYESTIPGIGLWHLQMDSDGYVVRRLSFGENPEFSIYCNGKNKLFIYEKSNKGFFCRVVQWDEKNKYTPVDMQDKKALLQTIREAKKDKYSEAGQKEYFVLLVGLKLKERGMFTVSKSAITQRDWKIATPNQVERKAASALAKNHLKEIRRAEYADFSYKSVLGYSKQRLRKITPWEKGEVFPIKIFAMRAEVIILPTLYETNPLGGDLISTVILREGNSYKFLGHIGGCLHSVGADIDGDGFPDLILRTCEPGEGIEITYTKIFSKTKALIQYSNN